MKLLPDESYRNIDIWFQDEARIGQQGTISRIWARRGTRPRVIKQQQFEYAYIFGAVCPALDLNAALVLPKIGIDAMNLHLEEISKTVPPGRYAVIVVDRATWHTSSRLRKFKNISILPLPPYSPELNPQERVWEWLRDNGLANRSYEDYEDIVKTSCEVWREFVSLKGRVRQMCTRKWATVL